MSAANARQKRILSDLVRGDLVFEVPQESYFTQFAESSGRQRRVFLGELVEMQERGWIRRVSPGSGRCDHWEISDAGREAILGGKGIARRK